MQNKFSVKLTIILLLIMLTISLGVVVAATITIPVRIHQQKQSLCVDSDYMSGELADINQLNCLQNGNPFNAKYGVGKIYVRSLPNDTGLILHLPFDGCSLKDISGLKNNPIENNITCVDTLFGKGIKFNGIDSKLIANYNPSLDSDRITISVWLKADAVSSTQTIIAKSDYPVSGYFLRIEPGTSNGVKITFFVGDSTGSSHNVVADNQDVIGKWVHIVAVYDGDEQAIWINGKKVSSLSWSGDIGLNTKNLEIGNEYDSNYFNGIIDEIAIYSRALTDEEIMNLFYEKLMLLNSTYDSKFILDESGKIENSRFETDIFLNNQYYLNKTFTLEIPIPDNSNVSVFYIYPSGYVDVKELSRVGYGEWNYSIEKFSYGVKNRLIINATLAGADGFDNGVREIAPDPNYSAIEISNDFLKIAINKSFYKNRIHPIFITVNDRDNNFLYEINLSNITVDDSKVYELYPNYTVYFYDWEAQKWKVWEKGVDNSTHGVPNWLDPAFRQELKWRFSFENNSNTNVSLNVTFLVTAHDPFIRMFIDASDQLSSMEHSMHIPIKTREKKHYASIFNNTFEVYDSTNISSLNISSYGYRKSIVINNSANNQNLTDYQLAINISYSSSMQPDFDDIRFYYVNSTGEYKIPYWIEQKVDSSWAYVWIKVPFIPDNQTDIGFGNGIAKVYMYYGNGNVTSESSGDDVFLFFDDFDGTSLNTSKWKLYTYGSSYSYNVNNGMLYLETGGTGNEIGIDSKENYDFTDDVAIEFKIDITALGPTDFASLLVHLRNRTNNAGKGVQWYQEGSWDRYVVGQAGSYWWSGENRGAAIGISRHEIAILTPNRLFWKVSGVRNFAQWTSKTNHFPKYPQEYLHFCAANGGKLYLDYIFVRRYANPEPIYSIGAEESLYKKDSSVNVLYDRSSTDIVLFFTENSKSIGLSLYNTSSDKLDLIEYKSVFSNSKNILISLSYTNPIDTTTGNLSTWSIGFSNETIEKIGNTTLTYYDIISWKKSGDYNSVQHNVSLVFHYNDTYKDDYGVGWYNYTGIEDSNSFTGILISNRSVNGNVHRIVDAGTSSYIVFNLTDHDSASQSDYDQRRIKIVVDYPAQKATYLLLDSLDERYGIRNQNNAYIILANNDNSNQIFLSSSERSLYSFSSNKSSIKEVELNLSAFHTGLTLGYIASDTTKDSDNDNIPDLLEDEESIGFSSSEKLTDFTKSSLGYYMLGYDGYKFIATFAYLDNEFSYTPFYLLGLRQPVGVENAYEIGYRTSNGATWYMFKSQPIAKFHLNSTSVAQTSNMIKYVTFKQKNITIYPEDELYIEGLPTTLSGEGKITYTKSNFLPKAELKLYVKYNQTMSYWVNYILPASADYLIIEISNPEKTHFSMKYNITNHDKITIPTNSWINDYWYNINSSCYSKNDIRYGMICSDASPEEVAVALVAGYGIADSLCYRNGTKYTLSLNTTSDKIIIPLTDNCKMVVNKMRSIETYGIPTTSFNEETAKSNYVTMTLSYDKIKVLGGLSFSNGYYRLCVRNVGREYGTTLVEIVRC